jgi:PKD repeat protein
MEKTITFATAPGSNGETVFYNVMRKMYPNANGNVLESSWTNGQTKTFSFKAKVPTYIYSFPQLAVVAWVQDDATKNVKQSAFSQTASAPLALAPIADFSSNVVTSCDGLLNFYDLSALFPTSWQWDFGDGTTSSLRNPTHQYSSSGTYPVQLIATNSNGSNTVLKSGFINVILSGTAPSGVSDNICSSGIANLSATAAGIGTLNWYNSLGNLVNTGTTYSPSITGTTNFWVAEMTANQILNDGSPDSALGAGATYTAAATQGLYFDVIKPCTLLSVKVYATTAGNRTIQVVDPNGVIVQTTTVNIPIGMSTVNLNFALNAGIGYLLKPSNFACNLYRNTSGASYPYNASGIVSITGNSASMPAYYYFFYDWKVQQNPCASPSVLVAGIDSCNTGVPSILSLENSLNVYPNPNNGSFSVSFNTSENDNYVLEVFDAMGRELYTELLNNFSGDYQKLMNLESIKKGIYLLMISGSKNKVIKKIVTF